MRSCAYADVSDFKCRMPKYFYRNLDQSCKIYLKSFNAQWRCKQNTDPVSTKWKIFRKWNAQVWQKAPFLKIISYPIMSLISYNNETLHSYTLRRSKQHINPVTHLLNSAEISIFSPEISDFCIKNYVYSLHFNT